MKKIFTFFCRFALVIVVVLLYGCVEVNEQIRIHDDGSLSFKATIKVDPQYEAMVLPKLQSELQKKTPKGVRLDFSQRIEGKAAVIIEADGEPATQIKMEDGSATLSITPDGFMKRRFTYTETVLKTPEYPFSDREVITFPGALDSVTNGKKVSSDTVEFDRTYAKRGDVFSATSVVYALNFGSSQTASAGVTVPGTPGWLIPTSIGSILAGVALWLTGWIRSRRSSRGSDSTPVDLTSMPMIAEHGQVDKVETVFCSECGASNTANRKFCSHCGQALG